MEIAIFDFFPENQETCHTIDSALSYSRGLEKNPCKKVFGLRMVAPLIFFVEM